MGYMHTPYVGTSIGSDGSRYANDDPNIPTAPVKAPGRGVTQADLDPVLEQLEAASPSRTVNDAVLVDADATVTSVAANWTAADIGAKVSGNTKVPADTVVASVNAENSVELSNPVTGAGTGQTLTFTRQIAGRLDALEA